MKTAPLYHPVTIGSLQLPGNLFLAPVAGYSDKSYRSLCVEWGADFTYTEMVSSEASVRTSAKTEKIIERAHNETCYAVQLFGANPAHMAQAASKIAEIYQVSCIDINSGCPMPKITKAGAGVALMRKPQQLYTVIKAVVDTIEQRGLRIPVTVKIRSGWSRKELTWKDAALAAVEAGAKAITLHPRTCEQCYSGKADWDILRELVACLHPLHIPVFGSGDIFTPEDAQRMLLDTYCDGVMFARGAMGNPFIFRQTKDFLCSGIYQTISICDRIAAGRHELMLLCQAVGEKKACLEMRKRFTAYIKGIPGGARIREQLVRASSVLEYERILQPYLQENR